MTAGLYPLAIGLCILLSAMLLPWRFFGQHLCRGLVALGRRCFRLAPGHWQAAWHGIRYLEYRLSLALVTLLILPAWGASAPPGAAMKGLILILLGGFFVAWPLLRANRQMQQRQANMVASLPAQLDLLAMLLVAGQPLLASLQQSSSSGMDNPLREELRLVVTQVRAGLATDEAFQRLSQRYPCRELRLFCSALQHARESGAGLASMLYEQAEQRRQELFLAAEKKAMEAPVKLMFPLLMFIFPGTVLVLVVTLAAKMMWQL